MQRSAERAGTSRRELTLGVVRRQHGREMSFFLDNVLEAISRDAVPAEQFPNG